MSFVPLFQFGCQIGLERSETRTGTASMIKEHQEFHYFVISGFSFQPPFSWHSFGLIAAPGALRALCFALHPVMFFRRRVLSDFGSPVPVPPKKLALGWGAAATRSRVPKRTGQEKGEHKMTFNRLTLIGFLGQDAEKRFTPKGTPYTVLSLATKTSWRDQSGEWQSHTEWHRVVVWGEKFAEFAATLRKGAHVQVEGPLRSREYERDGAKHRVVECKAESILKLDRAERQEAPIAADGEPISDDVPY
jgi:single-strand DNA-binding protein